MNMHVCVWAHVYGAIRYTCDHTYTYVHNTCGLMHSPMHIHTCSPKHMDTHVSVIQMYTCSCMHTHTCSSVLCRGHLTDRQWLPTLLSVHLSAWHGPPSHGAVRPSHLSPLPPHLLPSSSHLCLCESLIHLTGSAELHAKFSSGDRWGRTKTDGKALPPRS